ncbi:hypothetical protein HGM15179_013556 [Zosterops borbonicus]|uniref:Uncharacterized protein n=1 Tax=Zosterops borbonicus TaxID=364589 RepID=A0A8K1LH54_9PASS|nr:hypothetical protein HGM15179_013556 [Zosterops borbonicus]
MDSEGELLHKKVVVQSHPEAVGQQLSVLINISEKWCPQRSIQGPELFNISISDMDGEIEDTLSRFTDGPKLSGAVDMSEGWDTIKTDLKKWQMWSSQGQMLVLHQGQDNPRYQHRLGMNRSRADLPRKTWGAGG